MFPSDLFVVKLDVIHHVDDVYCDIKVVYPKAVQHLKRSYIESYKSAIRNRKKDISMLHFEHSQHWQYVSYILHGRSC